jgi:Flp pilus assembly protein TadB
MKFVSSALLWFICLSIAAPAFGAQPTDRKKHSRNPAQAEQVKAEKKERKLAQAEKKSVNKKNKRKKNAKRSNLKVIE